MKLKRSLTAAMPALVTLAGFGVAMAGLFLLAGLAVTLLVGGGLLTAAGLLVDF